MVKSEYLNKSIYSIKALSKNLVLYIPDLFFFIVALFLTYLFFNLNHLTSIFGGELIQFDTQIKNIVTTSPLLLRLFVSFLILIGVYLLIGLGTLAYRFSMITSVIRGKKASLSIGFRESNKLLLPLLWLKLSLLLVYLVPTLVLLIIGVLFQPLLLACIVLILILFIVTKVVLLFTYPTLLLKGVKGPLNVIKESLIYFNNNKLHTLAIVVFISVIGSIISLVFTFIPLLFGNFSILTLTSISSIIYLIVKTLADITVNLWSTLFTFKNY